jgi:hypothetical protein
MQPAICNRNNAAKISSKVLTTKFLNIILKVSLLEIEKSNNMKQLAAGLFPSLICIVLCQPVTAQKNKQGLLDPSLEAHSERWKVKQNRGLFGISKPEFGPYTTLDANKLDSPVLKKRTKDSTGTAVTISGEGWDWDISKYETVEKKKYYDMELTNALDTIQLFFSIYSISSQKSQTLAGELISKNDEGKNATLRYQKNISGVMITSPDSTPLRFFLEDYLSTKQTKDNTAPKEPDITRGYILTGTDSLFTEAIINSFGKPSDMFYLKWQRGLYVKNSSGDNIAALKFSDIENPFYAWIRNDLSKSEQHSIAALFAVLVAVMGI